MKVLIYLEGAKATSVSGIGRAYQQQIEALKANGVEVTLDKKDTFDVAHINSYGEASYRLLKKCKRKNIPVIVHGHSTHEDFRESFRCWKLLAPFYNHMMNRMYKRADEIITPSTYSASLIRNYKGVTCPVIALSNGIKLKDYEVKDEWVEEFKNKFNITNEKVVIGVGFYFKRKGIDDFFEVARNFKDIKFIWFGYLNPILTSSYINKCIRHKPYNVILPGYIKGDLIKGAMKYATCMLFPSREETEGIVALEALATRLPLVIRDIGVYEDMLTDKVNCFKGKNIEDFISIINYILTNDTSEVTNNGYNFVKSRELTDIGKTTKKIYEDLIASEK